MPKNVSSSKKKIKKKPKQNSKETVKETLLSYQIGLKERALEDVLFQVKLLEDEKKLLTERLEFLKRQQESAYKNLVVSAKVEKEKFEKSLEDVCTRDCVLEQIRKNMELQKSLEKGVDDIEEENLVADHTIERKRQELEELIFYRDQGQFEIEEKIHSVEKEIEDEKQMFEFMTDQLKKEFNSASENLDEETQQKIKHFRIKEADKALGLLNKYEKRIFYDNEWLKKEVEVHREEVERLTEEVLKMEEEVSVIIEEHNKKNNIPDETTKKMLESISLKSSASGNQSEGDINQRTSNGNKWPVTQEMLLNKLRLC